MANLVVWDKYDIAFTKASYCKVLLIVQGDNSDVMSKLKKFNNWEDNSATLNSEGLDFNDLSCYFAFHNLQNQFQCDVILLVCDVILLVFEYISSLFCSHFLDIMLSLLNYSAGI